MALDLRKPEMPTEVAKVVAAGGRGRHANEARQLLQRRLHAELYALRKAVNAPA